MNRNLDLDTLSNFWIIVDKNFNLTKTSEFFCLFDIREKSLLDFVKFTQPKITEVPTNFEILTKTIVNFQLKEKEISFRATFHQSKEQLIIIAWPMLRSFEEAKELELIDYLRHPMCQVFDQLILKDILKSEIENSLRLKNEKDLARKVSDHKSKFISNLSHEIRSPLTCILGFLEILKMEVNNEEINQIVDHALLSSLHLNDLINNVLDLSKIEAGKLEINNQNFILENLVEETLTMNQSLIAKKSLVVKRDFKRDSSLVNSDKLRVRQVFQNLLSNAIKFTPDGGTIKISLKSNEDMIQLSIINSADYLTPEKTKNLFKRYTQVHDNTDPNFHSTGLGLTLSKEISRLLKGDLFIDYEYKDGVKFDFHFQKQKLQDSTLNENKVIQISELQTDKPINVLLIDDDKDITMIIERYLEAFPHLNILIANSGNEGIKIFQNNIIDFVFVDMEMPQISGHEVVKSLRKLEEEKAGAASFITALTANAFTEHKSKMISAGCNEFFPKPIQRDMFKNFICQILSR